MGVIFKMDKRRIIPRWRSFKSASLTGELDLSSNTKRGFDFNTKEYLVEQKSAWKHTKNLSFAGDLLGSASVLGLEKEFVEVAQFIIENENNSSAPTFRVANKILNPITEPNEKESEIFSLEIHNPQLYYPEIKKLKFHLSKEYNNPIGWIELARLYSLVGLGKKAQMCIDKALHFDKNNRFIVRSASRFYHHFHEDKDLSLQVIKKSTFINHDPWLISAEIAFSTILGRFSKFTKIGKEMLDAQNINPFSITELASAVATFDYSKENIKNSKKYFKQSLIKPNDNSLAQAEWMSNSIEGIQIDSSKFDLPFAFEAKTLAAYDKEDFKTSFENAMRWQLDEPYSVRPILTASYIAATFLDRRKDGIKLLENGLKMNNDDIKILNNLIYYLALDGRVSEAYELYIRKLSKNSNDMDQSDIISVVATAGLLYYRNNEPEEGKKFYLKALASAKKFKNEYSYALAMLNFVNEEIRVAKSAEAVEVLVKQLTSICTKRLETDINLLYKQVLLEYQKLLMK